MPTSSTLAATASGPRSIGTPSASSRSTDPHAEDAARPPCLTTRAPAAAMTTAAIVEMFTVCAWSPPVPTMSTTTPGTVTCRACARMTSARPPISSAVSPLARSATAKAATWAGEASPDIMRSIAHAASCADRSSARSRRPSSEGHVGAAGAAAPGSVGAVPAGDIPAVTPGRPGPGVRRGARRPRCGRRSPGRGAARAPRRPGTTSRASGRPRAAPRRSPAPGRCSRS